MEKSHKNTLRVSATSEQVIQQVPLIQADQRQAVLVIIALIDSTANALGIEISDESKKILSEDIIEVYPAESLEDIAAMFKKARQGYYGFEMNSRKVLSMPLVRHWMTMYLEKKYTEVNKAIHNAKYQNQENRENNLSDEEVKRYLELVRKEIRPMIETKKSGLAPNIQRLKNEFDNFHKK